MLSDLVSVHRLPVLRSCTRYLAELAGHQPHRVRCAAAERERLKPQAHRSLANLSALLHALRRFQLLGAYQGARLLSGLSTSVVQIVMQLGFCAAFILAVLIIKRVATVNGRSGR